MQDSGRTMAPNIMTAFFIVCLTTMWMVIFTVKPELTNTTSQIIDSSHNGTVPVQDSSNQQQQDDELQCDFTGSEVQEVRRRKFFGLMKSLFDKTTHRRLPPPPTDAGAKLIWNIWLASRTIVRPAVSGVVAFVTTLLAVQTLEAVWSCSIPLAMDCTAALLWTDGGETPPNSPP